MTKKQVDEFVAGFSGRVKRDYPLAKLCSFKVGGPAKLVAEVASEQELVEALTLARKLKMPFVLIAGGNNTFFADKGFDGLVIHYIAEGIRIHKKELQVEAEAGVKLRKLIEDLAEQNLGGLNFLANIPGSLGGAVVGNAGCYGMDIGEYLVSARIYDMKTNKLATWKVGQLKFRYRHSKLKDDANKVVVSAVLKLVPDKKAKIIKAIDEERALRWEKHPRQPSAGSFFKNPKRGVPAWKFIDEAGMRGVTVGGAKISSKHSNHLVNAGGAKAADIVALAKLVIRKVKAKTGIALESEARYFDGKKLVALK